MNQFLKLLCAGFFLLNATVHASERDKVGLVLSGGGARGVAHIGVLRELERQRIPVDYITGTSMGAIIGGLYAAGNSTTEIEQILIEIDWEEILKDQLDRRNSTLRRKLDDDLFQLNKSIGFKNGEVQLPSGLIQGQKLQLLLDRLFSKVSEVENFDNLPIPFRAVATDIVSGEAVVLKSGSLATAIRASMSVPTIFSTVEIDGTILVDGGISNNLPVDVVRHMGADVVIAVDIGTPLYPKDKVKNVVGVTAQLTNLLVQNTTKRQLDTLTKNDILIAPQLGDFSSSDFNSSSEIIVNGVSATKAVAAQLEPISIPASEDFQPISQESVLGSQTQLITAIRINNNTAMSDEYIRSMVTQQLGSELDLENLENDIGTIYGLGILESVTYDLVHQPQGYELVLNVTEKPYGPKYLQFGLRYDSDFNENNKIVVTTGLTITPLNALNGEWRTIIRLGEEPGFITELHQPLALNSKYFLNASLFHTNQRFNRSENGLVTNEIRSRKFGGMIAVGRDLNRWGDFRFGVSQFDVNNDVEFGPVGEVSRDDDGGEYSMSLKFDTLDNLHFPTSGNRGFLSFKKSTPKLGASHEFDQVQFDFLNVSTWADHTLYLGAQYFSTTDGEVPVQNRFRSGGLFSFPGYIENELNGQNLYLIRTGYQRKIHSLLGTSPYLGLTLQYGNLYENTDEFSFSDGITTGGLWLGWKTLVGPMYLGYGRADTGNQSLYLSIGNFF
jgi:NTE family protein